jgi:4-aminobutyrate aminotransferase-like enzyme
LNSNSTWLARHRSTLAISAQRDHDPAFGPVFVRGQSARLWDIDGHEYLDLTSGYSASNFGHAFEPLVRVAQQQLGELTHLTGAAHTGKILLAERLLETVAPQMQCFNKVIFNSTGARAIETAWKAAVAFRPGKLLALAPGFHGRSLATSSISSTTTIGPTLHDTAFEVESAEHYPYCACCPLASRYPGCGIACAEKLMRKLEERAEEYSAVVVEPALGARGYVFPPAAFFQRLREISRGAGVLMIADEIQTGLGRCGDWLLSRQQGWEPDLVVIGKSLGGGITPISAVVGRADVLDAIPAGAESETFAASPFACCIALQVLHELQFGPWFERSKRVGQDLRSWFTSLSTSENAIQSIDGLGANCVLEFASSHQPSVSLASAQAAAYDFAVKLLQAGLLVHYTGPQQTRIVLLPPLTITDAELDEVKRRTVAERARD